MVSERSNDIICPSDGRRLTIEYAEGDGADEARFRPIGGFSTGMRQRTKLAQALVGDPELILLDEPTAGLDPGQRVSFRELLRDLTAAGGRHWHGVVEV